MEEITKNSALLIFAMGIIWALIQMYFEIKNQKLINETLKEEIESLKIQANQIKETLSEKIQSINDSMIEIKTIIQERIPTKNHPKTHQT